MFDWFKKRSPPPPPAEGGAREWVNMRCELGGKPVFVRIRSSLRPRSARAGYGHEVAAAIAFHEVRDNGLPSSSEELTEVDELEDWLKDRLESASRSVLALVTTGDGVRVCYFYSAEPDEAVRVWEEELQPKVRSHRVTLTVRPDEEWQAFRRFLG
jgi:Family of unknown function (DUF695)